MSFRSWLGKLLEARRSRSGAHGRNPVFESGVEMAKREPISLAMNTRILFVCMGNICRSPMAEGVFQQMVRQAGLDDVVQVGSAGTHAFHAGEGPDKRAQATASKRGYDIAGLRARRVKDKDFEDDVVILDMDWDYLSLHKQIAPKSAHRNPQLMKRVASDLQ